MPCRVDSRPQAKPTDLLNSLRRMRPIAGIAEQELHKSEPLQSRLGRSGALSLPTSFIRPEEEASKPRLVPGKRWRG